jgi:hypothetical protein
MFDCDRSLLENTLEHFRLQGTTGVNRNNDLLTRIFSVTEGYVTAHLVVPIPADFAECTDEAIPRNIPGEFAHTATSTVASVIVLSLGRGSPCFRALSM